MSKFCPRKNYALLALAIVYGIVAVLQFFADGIFSMQLYFSVAFISLLTTLCESMKSCTNWIYTLEQETNTIILEGQEYIKRNIEIVERYPELSQVQEKLREEYDELSQKVKPKPKTRFTKYLNFLDTLIPFVEVFQVICIAIITPLKIIPNNLQTNKIISVLSLLSVTFAFGSMYANEATSEIIKHSRARRQDFIRTSDYYINLCKTISEVKQAERDGKLQDGND